jgi:hypothetical protein
MAVATHISKNEDSERISNITPNDSPINIPATQASGWTPTKFITYECIGYGFTVGNHGVPDI